MGNSAESMGSGNLAVRPGRFTGSPWVSCPSTLGGLDAQSGISHDAWVALEAVVFDLFYTLVHPGEYPGGGGRTSWLARLLGLSERALEGSWATFEPDLESGRAPAADPADPELTWLATTYSGLAGRTIEREQLDRANEDWDLTQRRALLDPPQTTLEMLKALRSSGLKIGVLSNTHALESRSWDRSLLAGAVDAVLFSYEIGCRKPDPGAYTAILDRLGVPARRSAYVGDGANEELAGARLAGFALILLAAEAPTNFVPDDLPALQAQADLVVRDLSNLPSALMTAIP